MEKYFNVIDKKEPRQKVATAVVSQIKLKIEDLREVDGLLYPRNLQHTKRKIGALLQNLKAYSPGLIVFPELSVPDQILDVLELYSRENNTVIVGGSHYAETGGGRISVSPVFIDGVRHDVHKLRPSPYELSMFEGDSLASGTSNTIFLNTSVGNFAILICSDFLHDDILNFVTQHELDFLIVPSCQKDSNRYFSRFAELVRDSRNGLYALFPNLYIPGESEGKSGVLGVVDDIFLNSAISKKITDGNPGCKLWEAGSGNDFVVAEFNLLRKKPYKVKNKEEEPNVVIKRTRSHVPRTRPRENDTAKYKMVAFDVDGTLIRGTKFSWVKLWEFAGDTTGEMWKSYLRKFRNAEISYDRWCQTAVSYFRTKGMTHKDVARLAMECKLTENFFQGIKRLKSEGFIVGIISGGIDVFVEELIPKHEEIFDFEYINNLTFKINGTLAGVESTKYDFEQKFEALELECDERGLSTNEAIFVGDQFNDHEILRHCGHAIVYSEFDDPVGLTAHKSIHVNDFNILVDYICSLKE